MMKKTPPLKNIETLMNHGAPAFSTMDSDGFNIISLSHQPNSSARRGASNSPWNQVGSHDRS
jgi:hypothetical protein